MVCREQGAGDGSKKCKTGGGSEFGHRKIWCAVWRMNHRNGDFGSIVKARWLMIITSSLRTRRAE